MEWSDDIIAQLRAFWAEGLSTAEIGRRLGVTKNAIVGKAHRLDLDARPSPIKREHEAPPPRRVAVRRMEGPTLPPLPSTVAEAEIVPLEYVAPAPAVLTAVAMPEPVAAPPPPRPVMLVPPVPRPVMVAPRPAPPSMAPRPSAYAPRPTYGRVVTCCWPIGEPGTRDFRFCDDASEPGRPYCEEHVKIAYVKVRDRREDAA